MRAPPTLEATAIHEAGHAVAALRLGLRLDEVSIVPVQDQRGEQKGRVKCGWGDDRAMAIYLLAGGIAQDLFCPGYELGAEDDEREVSNWVCVILGASHTGGYPREREAALLAALRSETKGLLLAHEREVRGLAGALLIHRHLKGDAAARVVEQVGQ